ncbi:MAG: hypothetical protein IKS65_08545 [Bacteroidales bacterium]|nr:hypothetical protein [Bacteroidales bacterium]
MRFKRLIFILLAVIPFITKAQQDIKKDHVSTWMFQVTYAYQSPGQDTKVLFGNNHSVGGSVIFKTKSNWLFSINGNFISGNEVNITREELFGDILDNNGQIITGDGIYGSYALFERGAHFQAKVGKIFPVLAPNPNCGFFVQGGLGYLFNRIRCEFGSYASPPPALAGDYKYGYDRMRGGFAWSGEIGYLFMSNSRVLNFSLSLEFVQAYTKSLREWDFNMMSKDKNTYIDQYFGIRAAIYIPTYRRKPAEYYYN